MASGSQAAWLQRARELLVHGRAADALAAAARVLAGPQPSADAWSVRAAALVLLGQSSEALLALAQALALQPTHVEALTARAMLLYLRGDNRAALEDCLALLRLDPDRGVARMGRVVAELPWIPATAAEVTAARQAFGAALTELAAELRRRPCRDATLMVGSLQPFVLAYQEFDNRDLLSAYGEICAASMAEWRRSVGLGAPVVRSSGARIRVAIVSAHVRRHAVYQAITRGWLRTFDRSRFELALLHLGAGRDADSAVAASLAEHYQHGERSPLEWTRSIGAYAPDVVLYPEVGMDGITLQLASQRLAPVQLAAWGHPQTTGLPTIDYFLSAAAFEPPAAQQHYVERLVLLPNLGCYYDPDDVPQAAGPHAPRSGRVRLVCAGSPFKYAPQHDRVLVEIARRAPEVELHFFSYQDAVLAARLRARLEGAFREAGLEPAAFLVWRPWCDAERFHGFLRSADLLLDTLGFSGFNTVAQALACGLPVVAQRGRYLRGRLGAAILSHLSLDSLAVDTPEEYVERVVSLVGDPAGRSELRRTIHTNLPRLYRDASSSAYLQSFLETAVNSARPGGR